MVFYSILPSHIMVEDLGILDTDMFIFKYTKKWGFFKQATNDVKLVIRGMTTFWAHIGALSR